MSPLAIRPLLPLAEMREYRRRGAGWLLISCFVLSACSPVSEEATTTASAAAPSTTATTQTTSSLDLGSTSTSDPTIDTIVQEPPGQLLVVGDWGSGTLPQGAVAGSMQRYAEAHVIDAILTTGDNFYSDDTEFLMRPYGWVEEQEIPWWITWGNHDVESESRIAAIDETFDSPPRWVVYAWGRVDVVILDSNQVSSLEQAFFFLQSMASSERPMVVALHHPPYSCSHYGSTIDVVNEMVGLLDDDVVLVLAGHDHNYQRFENAGITYIVTGGGGRDLYPLRDCPVNHPEQLAGAELYHFLALEQLDDEITVTAMDVNGSSIEEISIPIP